MAVAPASERPCKRFLARRGFFHFDLLEGKVVAAGTEIDMKLLSGRAPVAPRKMLIVSVVVAAVGLPSIALAEADSAAHAETASALRCLLNHGQNGCRAVFVGSASRAAQPWVWPNPNRDFELGALISSEYVRTETGDNVYVAKLLDGRTTDLYDVKFKHDEKTFYIARPGTDGKIHQLLIRDGGPVDEKTDLFVRGPG